MACLGSDTPLPNATGPCTVSQQLLEEQISKDFEILTLNVFLTEDKSMAKTIDNLQQLLEHMSTNNLLSKAALFNARRALISLETLTSILKKKV